MKEKLKEKSERQAEEEEEEERAEGGKSVSWITEEEGKASLQPVLSCLPTIKGVYGCGCVGVHICFILFPFN